MHCNKALKLDKKGMFSEAEKEYFKALQLNPGDPYALYNLGCHYRENNDKKAYLYHKMFLVIYESFENLSFKDPDQMKADTFETYRRYYIESEDMGIMLSCAADTLNLMDDPKAKNFLRKAVRLSPDSAPVRYNMGIYYLNKEYYEDALKEFQKAHVINPDDPNTIVNIGHCLCYMNMREEEANLYEEYLKNHQPTVEILTHLSFAYLDLDRYDYAVISFREYASSLPDSAEAHAGLALVYAHKGWKNESYKEIEVARQLNATAHDEMAEELIHDALEILEDPDNDPARILLLLLLLARMNARRRMQKI